MPTFRRSPAGQPAVDQRLVAGSASQPPDRFRPRRVPVLRARLPRSAIAYWSACLVLAAVTALGAAALVGSAARAERRYGRTEPVLVATSRLKPGAPLDAGNVEVRQWPRAMVPTGSLSTLPSRGVATAAIEVGEPVASTRVSGSGRSGPAALIAPGRRAVAVPLAVAGLPLASGDVVDLVPVSGPSSPNGAAGARSPAASDAVVVAVTAQAVTVAVRTDDLARVAAALGQGGGVVVALHPPGG